MKRSLTVFALAGVLALLAGAPCVPKSLLACPEGAQRCQTAWAKLSHAGGTVQAMVDKKPSLLKAAELKSVLNLGVRAALAKKAESRGDVLAWGKATMPSKFSKPFCPLHDYLVSIRKDPLISVRAPRWHSKTTIGLGLVPLYQALVEPKKPPNV